MRTRRHKLQVSTFPFLAVLLCAMGALLLVLLVMDRRAHDAARFRAAQAVRRSVEEAGREAEARHSAFERQRQEAEADRQRGREAAHARLAGQEADMQKEIRLVRDELARAAERLRAEQDDEAAIKQKIEAEHAKAGEEERALAAVRAEEAAKAARSETSRKELEQMTAALARLEKNLADLKEARKREENTYSVVPYNGKRGENRRPVYVECAAGRVVFHPDRTPLDEPLNASAVRAEVERRLAREKEGLPAAQAAALTPYLMLLIRPDGVSTYYRFRQALQGFRIDFGYEFVDKDWVLDFPTEDRDSPSPAWLIAAKPSEAGPSSPDTTSPRMRGVPSAPGQEEVPAVPKPGGNGAGPPGAPSLLTGSGVAYSAGAGGLPFPAGSASAGPRGATGVGPAAGPGGPSLFAPSGVGPGTVAGPAGGPRPYPGGGSPNAGATGFGPANAGAAGDGPPGAGTSGDGPPGPAAPGDARPTAAGPGGSSSPAAQRGSPGNVGGSPTPPPLVVASTAGSGQPAAPGDAGPATGEPPTAPGGAGPASGGSPAPSGTGASRSSTAGSWATQGAQAAPASADHGAQADKSSGSPAPDPNQGTSTAPPPVGAAKTPPSGRMGGTSGGTAGDGEPDDDPFLRAPPSPPLPHKTRQPAPLRPARLSGDRDWIIYVECKPEGVVIYPTQLLVPVAALNRPAGNNPLPQTIQQLIDRKQATVRRGEMPYRPEVRFLVRPEAERTYHLAYPTLDGLAAPKTSQNLGPEDDVSAVVAGH